MVNAENATTHKYIVPNSRNKPRKSSKLLKILF